MSTLAERLTAAMTGPPRVTQAELARACGIKPPSVSDWLNGRTKNLEGTNLLKASALLNVRPEWLAGEGGPMRSRVVEVRAHGTAPREAAVLLGLEAPVSQSVRQGEETMAQALVLLQVIAAARPTDRRFRNITWGMVQAAAKAVADAESEADAVTRILATLPQE